MSKKTVHSDKISGNHTTLIDVAIPLIDSVVGWPEVRRVTPGFIKSGLKARRTHAASVKIDMNDDYIRIQVRGNISTQEIHIYTANSQKTTEALARVALNEGYKIKFDKREKENPSVKPERQIK
ncbi:MAG: DUF2103 domain-containing protein [Patescibacteria group bacterium]